MPGIGLSLFSKTSYDYLIYYSGSRYEALNGNTGDIDYTHVNDGAVVLNSAITAVSSAGGGIIQIRGTILCRSSVIIKDIVIIKGAAEGASIKLDSAINLTGALVDSFNFATLTGLGVTGGVHHVYIENLTIDGNRSNNTTIPTIGLRYYGYNWHLNNVHVKECHGIGHYSEWATDPVNPVTGGATMNSYYDAFVVNNCDGIGWHMRGPHDSQIVNCAIYSCASKAMLIEYVAGVYDGSCEMTQMHIWDCQDYGIHTKGGNLRFRGLTCESIWGPSGTGLVQEGSTVTGVNYEAYLCAKGLWIISGGDTLFSGSFIHDNTSSGVEIYKNNVIIDGVITGNGAKGIIVGSSSIQVANVSLRGYIYGHTTAQIDWGNSTNKGISGNVIMYMDSTHQTGILNESTIDLNTNSFTYESFADGTGVRALGGRPLTSAAGAKSPFAKKFGQLYVGHNIVVTDGLYQNVNQTIAATFVPDQWEGITAQYNTGTTTGTRAGLNSAASGIVTLFTRTSYPSKKTHLKASNTGTRFYGGFSSLTAMPVTDTPLGNTDSGVIVGWNSTDVNIKIYRNDGTAAPPTATDTGIVKPANFWTYEIVSDDINGTFVVNIVSGATLYTTTLTTRVPSSTTRLATYDIIENTDAVNQTLQIDSAILESRFIQ